MASVYRDTKRSKFWIACYTGMNGERIQAPTKLEDEDAANIFARNLERAVEMARNGKLSGEKARLLLNDTLLAIGEEPLLETSAEEWFRDWLNDNKNSTASGTHLRYGAIIHEFLKSLGKKATMSLRQLSINDVRKYRDKLLDDGVSASSANVALKTLRSCLNTAVNQGYRAHNPANAVNLCIVTSKRKKPFTPDQIAKLLAASPSQEWRNLIKMGYYLGGRLGDISRILIEQFDRKTNTLTYTPSKQRRTKVPEDITIPLHPAIFAIIDDAGRTSGPLFPTLSKKGVSGKTGLSLSFRTIIDDAGIPYETSKPKGKRGRKIYSLGFHSLRRSFNTDLANLGVSQEIRQKLVGHASAEVNDIYTDLQTDTLRRAVHLLPTISEPKNTPAVGKKSS